jgi:serine O-acetyltransferase
VPGKTAYVNGVRVSDHADLEHGRLPDPEEKALSCLADQLHALERRVRELEGGKKDG